MKSPFQSIRWRLQAWHGLILLAAVTALCFTTYRLAWNHQLHAIDQSLYSSEGKLTRALLRGKPASPFSSARDDDSPAFSPTLLIERLRVAKGKLPSEVASLFEGTEPGYTFVSYRDASGAVFLESPNFPEGAQLLPIPAGRYAEEWRIVGHRRELLRSSKPGLSSLVGRDISPELDSMYRFAWSLGASGFAIWLVCLFGGWWIAGTALKPISTIGRTAARITDGNLQERISTSGTDSELDQLSRVLNHTFDRLQTGIEQQKQFIVDASHELRTPVTILLSETQRILKQDRKRTPEEYIQVINTCRDAANRMRRLIEPLLILARQDALGAGPLREHCEISQILRDTLEQVRPLASGRNIHLNADLRPAPCIGDPTALAILATNLIVNAIQHNREGGEVRVSCEHSSEFTRFSVSDDGPGIVPEDRPHVFERFYRADKSRTSASGHAGLGLAIAKAVVENHRGKIVVEDNLGKGAVFVVTLPLYKGELIQASSA